MVDVSPYLRRLLTVAIIILILIFPTNLLAFTDTGGHWARPTIDHLSSRGLVNGYPDGSFLPDASVNRAELATLLVTIMDKDEEARQLEKGTSSFTDCQGHWARGYIEVARELDIIRGDGQGGFAPQRPVSREEAVVMLANSLGLADSSSGSEFQDVRQIAEWARGKVAAAEQVGLVSGFPDGTFRPQSQVTRAEVSILLEEFLACKGQAHHFYGSLTGIDLRQRKAEVEFAGQKESFELESNLSIYERGKKQPLDSVPCPAWGYFDINRSGKLVQILLDDKPPAARLQTNLSLLPDSMRLSPGGNVVQLSQDEDTRPVEVAPGTDPSVSLRITRDAIGFDRFNKATGATGKGQLVAIIDSGVDPGHRDLQNTTQGFKKIVDYIDLTGEGQVQLQGAAAENGYLSIGTEKVNVSAIPNQAELYRYGYLKLDFLPESFTTARKPLLVVVAASQTADRYDRVYLDSNGDGDLSDEKPFQHYAKAFQVIRLASDGKAVFNLVVANLDPVGNSVCFGFDALGHGTQVAGIVAARGQVEGVAPDAQILPIKVLNRMGTASLGKLESALAYAAERGARIAVLSLGQYNLNNREREAMAALTENLWKAHGMIICIAAGNNGPGLQSVAETAVSRNIISVGALATPEMWNRDYGFLLDSTILPSFSSIGPSSDGSMVPLVVAPGTAVSTYPLWSGESYRLDEGTSMAAPHVAGALALLMDASAHLNFREDSAAVCQALLAGAKPLPGYQPVEQGLGVINLPSAWEELKQVKGSGSQVIARQTGPGYGSGGGYYLPGLAPALSSLRIVNPGDTNQTLALGGLVPWIKPQQYTIQVPARGERRLTIGYENLTEPGLYSGLVVADDHHTPGYDLAVLQTVVIPYILPRTTGEAFVDSGKLSAGRYQRYFFSLPEGIKHMDLKLDVGDKGLARIYVKDPYGKREDSVFAGVGENLQGSVSLSFTRPPAGIWEVVVYGSAALNLNNLEASEYTLKVELEEAVGNPDTSPRKNPFLITSAVGPVSEDGHCHLTLFFWNRNSKQPAEGLVSINGRMYEIFRGKVELEARAENGLINLDIAW